MVVFRRRVWKGRAPVILAEWGIEARLVGERVVSGGSVVVVEVGTCLKEELNGGRGGKGKIGYGRESKASAGGKREGHI